jgi:uncharacterized protein (DUF1800 family)
MRRLALAALLLVAGQAWAGMGPQDARHLLERTGFEARLDDVDSLALLSRGEAVDRTLSGVRTVAVTPPSATGAWVSPQGLRRLSDEERRRTLAQFREHGLALKAWWIGEMLATDSPLTERMTLFWHGHFATSIQKVRSPVLMQRQNAILRQHALGNFRTLLQAAARDPALLVYLDAVRSRRDRPNENFAREVMELFTLGEGAYGEQDVKEAARAFTGWSMDPENGEFVFRPGIHDRGVKTVLGKTGNWRGEDVLDILLARPETAQFIAAKLWREFISPAPASDAEKRDLERAARRFRESGYEIRALLTELLRSDAFWAEANRAALIKSPVDVVVGTLRQFRVDVRDPAPFALLLRSLGQDLLAPPNVKGWPGGEAWINSQTLLARRQFVDRLLRVDESRMAGMQETAPAKPAARRMMQAMQDLEFSAGRWLGRYEGRAMPSTAQMVLLAAAPHGEPREREGLAMLRAIVADPVYQLR